MAIKKAPLQFVLLPLDLYKNDEEVMLATTNEDGRLLSNMIAGTGETYNPSEKVELAALNQNAMTLKLINRRVYFNREIALSAVQQNGMALMYAREFKKDKEVVLEAIKQNSLAFYLADSFLQKDKDILDAYKKSVKTH
jgi:hypothetical protein